MYWRGKEIVRQRKIENICVNREIKKNNKATAVATATKINERDFVHVCSSTYALIVTQFHIVETNTTGWKYDKITNNIKYTRIFEIIKQKHTRQNKTISFMFQLLLLLLLLSSCGLLVCLLSLLLVLLLLPLLLLQLYRVRTYRQISYVYILFVQYHRYVKWRSQIANVSVAFGHNFLPLFVAVSVGIFICTEYLACVFPTSYSKCFYFWMPLCCYMDMFVCLYVRVSACCMLSVLYSFCLFYRL